MRVAIIGAGAVGRGVLAPLFTAGGCSVGLIDKDTALVRRLGQKGEFAVLTVQDDTCTEQKHRAEAYMVPEEASEYLATADTVVVCVGVDAAVDVVRSLESVDVIICCENDIRLLAELRTLRPDSRIGFAVPDIIAYSERAWGNDVPRVVVNPGTVHVSDVGLQIPNIRWCDDIDYYWARKAFLHNTTHAVLACVSDALDIKHVPDAMAVGGVRAIVEESLKSLATAVSVQGLVPAQSAARYVRRELQRLQEPLFRDSMRRITRSPGRKLGKTERFFSAIELVSQANGDPFTIELGAACCILAVTRTKAETPKTLASCLDSVAVYWGLSRTAPVCQRVGTLLEALVKGESPIALAERRP